MSFGARALIRLGALTHNLTAIRKQSAGAAVMAVVKANAYGHGLTVVARALADADSFAVARLPEALELRAAGIQQAIVLLSGVYSSEELQQSAEADCEIVVHCEHQVELLERHSEVSVVVWLKIDTGMNRLGFEPGETEKLVERLRACHAVRELRLMTHLSNADNRQDPKTAQQFEQFASVANGFQGDISVANSGGIFGWPHPGPLHDRQRIWVRPGIALYGVSPFPETNGSELGLQPVMQFESRLVAVKALRKGERVGYGGLWQAERDTVLGIISAGYGDGFSRFLPAGTPVLINDRTVPLAGVVSMDMAAVDLGPTATDSIGDAVVLWGDELPVEEIARQANTIAYALICGVMNREQNSIAR